MGHFFRILAASAAACAALNAPARDIPQWRGDRTGIYPETGLLKSWPEKGPDLKWHSDEVGLGYSGPAIVGDSLYIMGTTPDKKREFITVLDRSGKKQWSLEYGRAWEASFQDARVMPAYSDGLVYVISGAGEVVCIDPEARAVKWKVDAMKEFGGRPMGWGYGENPLVSGGKVFFTPGGSQTSMVALDAKTGKLVWKTESLGTGAAYVSPIEIEVGGAKQIVGGVVGWMFGADPDTGKLLWKFKLDKLDGKKKGESWDINAATPVFKDGKLFVTAGYDMGAYQIDLSGGKAREVWSSPDMDTHHGGTVLLDGKLYGPSWINNDRGNWICLDWATGKKEYEHVWTGRSKGSVTSADGMLYIYEEKRGDIALVRPTPEKFDIVSSFRVPMGKGRHWCHIVVCDGVMYVRRGDVLMAFDVKAGG